MRGVVAVAFVLALAGCSDSPRGEPAAPGDAASPTAGPGEDGGEAPGIQEGNASAAPPAWAVGQAWTWRLESDAIPEPLPVTTVVLAADASSYQVGVTNVHEALLLYPFHLVGMGTVDAATLAWAAHGQPVGLLRFPLRDGDTFTSDLWGAPGAQVTIAAAQVTGPDGPQPGFRSTARYAGSEAIFLEADYAPQLGQFVRVASHFGAAEPFAQATLTGTGADETGKPFTVTDLARASADGNAPQALAPQQFTVPDVTVLLLACFESGQGAFSALVHVGSNGFGCQGTASASTELHVVTGPGDPGAGEMALVPPPTGSLTAELFAVTFAG